jgi:hypothetical protein
VGEPARLIDCCQCLAECRTYTDIATGTVRKTSRIGRLRKFTKSRRGRALGARESLACNPGQLVRHRPCVVVTSERCPSVGRPGRDDPGRLLSALLSQPTPTLLRGSSPILVELRTVDLARLGLATRSSPLRPDDDQPSWHGSGTRRTRRPLLGQGTIMIANARPDALFELRRSPL